MQKKLESETGYAVQADGKVVNTTIPDSSAFGPGKAIRWKGGCPDGLVGYDETAAARRGDPLLMESEMPHPSQFNSDAHRCVSPKSIARARNTSSSQGRSMRGIYGLVTACAKLAAKAQQLSRAELSCSTISDMYSSKADREAFCGTVLDADNQHRCEMNGDQCVGVKGVRAGTDNIVSPDPVVMNSDAGAGAGAGADADADADANSYEDDGPFPVNVREEDDDVSPLGFYS